jgi:general secretion pathway protein G
MAPPRIGRFTILEGLAVLVILLVMLTVTLASLQLYCGHGDARSRAHLKILEVAIEQYNQEWGYYPAAPSAIPSSAAWLDSLQGRSGKPLVLSEMRIKDGLAVDAYGNSYQYRYPGKHSAKYDLWSPGKNGPELDDPNSDDLNNWRS